MVKKLLNRMKAITGIYALGFNPDSVKGLLLPILFVLIVGGGLSVLVWLPPLLSPGNVTTTGSDTIADRS